MPRFPLLHSMVHSRSIDLLLEKILQKVNNNSPFLSPSRFSQADYKSLRALSDSDLSRISSLPFALPPTWNMIHVFALDRSGETDSQIPATVFADCHFLVSHKLPHLELATRFGRSMTRNLISPGTEFFCIRLKVRTAAIQRQSIELSHVVTKTCII